MFTRDSSPLSKTERIQASGTDLPVSSYRNAGIFSEKPDDEPLIDVVHERLIPEKADIQPVCSTSPHDRRQNLFIGRSQPFAYSAREPLPSI